MSRNWCSTRLAAGVALVTGLLAVSGCGRASGSVSGKVSLNGTALKAGNVAFVPVNGGGGASASITEDGRYTVTMIYAGEYKVVVETSSLMPHKGGMGTMPPGFRPPGSKASGPPAGAKSGPPPGMEMKEGYVASSSAEAVTERLKKLYTKIPAQYEDGTKTPLTYTVVGGSQQHDIDLK